MAKRRPPSVATATNGRNRLRFFDASALVKRYVRESGTTTVRRLLREGRVAVSRLSEVEVSSAFARLTREGALDPVRRDRAITALSRDLQSWYVVEMTSEITASARTLLLLTYALRSGDAVQLASAQFLEQSLGAPLDRFVTYDGHLFAAARAAGFRMAGGVTARRLGRHAAGVR